MKPRIHKKPQGYASPSARAARRAERAEQAAFDRVLGTGASRGVEQPAPPPPVVDPAAGAVANIVRWRKAPWIYVREVFKVEPDAWQDEALHALIESGFQKFCMKACKGPGKSCLLAWVIWWFLTCFTHPKILVTSITEDNLNDNLWTELAFWRQKSPMLSGLFTQISTQIFANDHPDTWFCSARTWPKEADKTRQAATLAGQHAQHTMIVLDEGGGIPTGVLVAGLAHHSTQDPNKKEIHYTFMAGNPDTEDSALGWACTEDARNWWVREITGDPEDPKRSPRIDKKWAQDMIDTFGRDNPWVLVNVFGKFPPVGSNKLIGSDQVRRAMACVTDPSTWKEYPRVMTLDVARSTGRDRSVLGRRQGSVVFPFKIYRLDDANELGGQVAFEFARWPADMIIVDAVGVGGPVADHLRALGLPVVMFHGGAPARDGVRFADRRTETWWECTKALKGVSGGEPELALPASAQELISELPAPCLHWTRKGQMKLESKEDMQKRGVGSPDVADALTMSFAEPTLVRTQVPRSTQRALQQRHRTKVDYDPYADEEEAHVDS